MEISEQQLQKFIRLYREHFGKDIDRNDALIQADKLLRLVALLRKRHRARIVAQSSRP
jgi:hypothetical protein